VQHVADDRAAEALDHLQTAALELIAAFRAVLDVAEEAVREPHGLLDVLTATARAAADVVATGPITGAAGRASTQSGGPGSAASESASSPKRTAGVEHISIS
jgi:hypothetical protein